MAAAAFAQSQRPLPAGSPEEFTAPSVRVALVAHEDLDPDRLRRLARRDVTLWLQTRSNTLRGSTLENIGRFDEAFVQLRAPLSYVDAQALAKLAHAGVWVDVAHLSLLRRVPGARRVAVEFTGSLTVERADELGRAKPALIRWSPGPSIDLMEWGLFRQLPGRKIVVMQVASLRAVACAERDANQPSVEIDLASVLTVNSDVYPCGRSSRVVVRPETDHWVLQSLVVREPSVELVVGIAADDTLATKTRALLDLLDRHDSR